MVALPPAALVCTVMTLAAWQIIHRIHETRFGATDFNHGLGSSRFPPIKAADRTNIHTGYTAATSFACVAFEYVFHDIDVAAEFKKFKSVSCVRSKSCCTRRSSFVATYDWVACSSRTSTSGAILADTSSTRHQARTLRRGSGRLPSTARTR
jgi:hypothetical protein